MREETENGQNETMENREKSGENDYQNFLDLPSEYEEIKVLFEKLEAGSGAKLDEFAKHGFTRRSHQTQGHRGQKDQTGKCAYIGQQRSQ